MNNKPKPDLSVQRAEALITEVQAADRETVRQAIREAVQTTQAQWIETPMVAEALAQELIAVARNGHHSGKIAAYLRTLADTLDQRPDLH